MASSTRSSRAGARSKLASRETKRRETYSACAMHPNWNWNHDHDDLTKFSSSELVQRQRSSPLLALTLSTMKYVRDKEYGVLFGALLEVMNDPNGPELVDNFIEYAKELRKAKEESTRLA